MRFDPLQLARYRISPAQLQELIARLDRDYSAASITRIDAAKGRKERKDAIKSGEAHTKGNQDEAVTLILLLILPPLALADVYRWTDPATGNLQVTPTVPPYPVKEQRIAGKLPTGIWSN